MNRSSSDRQGSQMAQTRGGENRVRLHASDWSSVPIPHSASLGTFSENSLPIASRGYSGGEMRLVLLLVCCRLVAGFQWVGGHTKNANENVLQQEQDQREARRLWEQALAAKGGREKLHRVPNVLESYQDKSHVGLY